jgi:hypothetical protein
MIALPVGSVVTVPPPFGDGAAPRTVIAVQYLDGAGAIVSGPTAEVQYILDDGYAYSHAHIAAS